MKIDKWTESTETSLWNRKRESKIIQRNSRGSGNNETARAPDNKKLSETPEQGNKGDEK